MHRLHQNLYMCSAKTLRWILPHYLKFCLSDEGIYSGTVTEFLIYSLDPKGDLKNKTETEERLSLLDKKQINCLIHFLQWCSTLDEWRHRPAHYINEPIGFLSGLRKK